MGNKWKDLIYIFSYGDTTFDLMTSGACFPYPANTNIDSDSESNSDGRSESLTLSTSDGRSESLTLSTGCYNVRRPYFRSHYGDHEYLTLKPTETRVRKAGGRGGGDVFLTLGWMIERNQDGFHRATAYVCALNLSTEPVSMWLIFDYLLMTEDGRLAQRGLPEYSTSYGNEFYDHFCTLASCNFGSQCEGNKSHLKPSGGYQT